MALALRVDEYLPQPPSLPPLQERPRPGTTEATRSAVEKEIRERLDLLQATVKMLEDYEATLESGSARLLEAAEKIRDLERLDDTILELRARERALADAWLPGIKRSLENRKEALRSRHPSKRFRFAGLLARDANTKIRGLEILRDCRLKLAEIAAELDTEVDSPIFDNDEDLANYLKSL